MPANAPGTVSCRIELFGLARLAAGRKTLDLALPAEATLADAVASLAEALPQLVGKAITPDRSGLMDGYVLNVNGTSFARSLRARVSPGDQVLLLSDQAGG